MRRAAVLLAAVVSGSLALAVAVPPSAASWVDSEWITAPVGALECGDPGAVDAVAWGRVLTGEVAGEPLDPVTAIDGITVTNTADGSVASSAAVVSSLGSDAWTSELALTALSGLTVGAGVPLPFGASTGAYTQYGRATSAGLSVGAAGAVTSGGSGVVALEPPDSATPRLADLRLSSVLDSALPGLGVTTAQLADVGLRIGAVGAIATLDSCDPLWAGDDGAASVARDYVVSDLGLEFSSTVVSDFATGLQQSLASLETELDAVLAPGTSVTGSALTSITSALNSAINLNLLGVTVTLGQVNSVRAGIDVNLAPVIAQVTGTRTDGVVTVDLGTGWITADLAALLDAAYTRTGGLNGLDPNTRVLTAPVLGELSRRVGGILDGFVTGTIEPALDAALDAAAVTVELDTTLRTRAGIINVLGLRAVTTITGTPAAFTTGTPAPTVSVVASEASSGILGGLLALLGINLSSLVAAVQSALVAPLVSTVVPVIGSTVVGPALTTISGLTASFVSTLTADTVPGVLTTLEPVLDALNALLEVTVNARPDAADPVGAPAAEVPGRFFESALHVGVVDGVSDPVLSLFFANASVGPNSLR